MLLEYSLVHPSAFCPTRANPSDAGLDVYYSRPPDGLHIPISIRPSDSKIIPTGLRFGVPHGYMLEAKNRSSVAAKRSLLVGACVIDSGYDGEVFINLHNVGAVTQTIEVGAKIAQLVLVPVVHFRAQERKDGELYKYPITISGRGTGALGSTGK
jgi:dUTP pyrophosphatase